MKRVLISILARVKGNVNANGTIAALTEIKKFFTTEGETKVFVSGRCVKYCIKQRLNEKGEFELSPLERRRRVVQSKGNPVRYIDDDLFGFMITETEEKARRRFAPIKTDGIVALRHCEITRDFGARFDPSEKENPSPFEVEVADFIGQNNWILTENIGRFEEQELVREIIQASNLEEKEENERKVYYLPQDEREKRLKTFLEILLKERYTFPRSATGMHQPQYYYAVVLPTRRLLPLFAHIDYVNKNGKILLDMDKLRDLVDLLNGEEKVTIIDFEHVIGEEIEKRDEFKSKPIEILKPQQIDSVINEITNFLISA
ncbi:type I-B CRISPR-associated protein Cas7/Cst2/DevR [Candidatus Bathyarchaeota archaeon]|nr:MAG: type I-B CRISPR-associated protein Cas7/Cst2/DevR [Candidatus Bathyarchaeota archaeon]